MVLRGSFLGPLAFRKRYYDGSFLDPLFAKHCAHVEFQTRFARPLGEEGSWNLLGQRPCCSLNKEVPTKRSEGVPKSFKQHPTMILAVGRFEAL